jgi:hypothetical protein
MGSVTAGQGLKQRDGLASLLFHLALKFILRNANTHRFWLMQMTLLFSPAPHLM